MIGYDGVPTTSREQTCSGDVREQMAVTYIKKPGGCRSICLFLSGTNIISRLLAKPMLLYISCVGHSGSAKRQSLSDCISA